MNLSTVLHVVAGMIPAILAITMHEVAHAWAANRLGDPTAARLGRLSLNPLRHVDPIGTVLVPAIVYLSSHFFFGWAKPVPVIWQNLRRLPRDIALVAVAGPAANLAMLIGWVAVLKVCSADSLLAFMSETGIGFNATIMLLNLIPIPPLDGSRIVTAALPRAAALAYNKLEPFGLIIMAVLLATGVVGALLNPGMRALEYVIRMMVN